METGTSFFKREDVQIICFRQRDLCHTDGEPLLNLPIVKDKQKMKKLPAFRRVSRSGAGFLTHKIIELSKQKGENFRINLSREF